MKNKISSRSLHGSFGPPKNKLWESFGRAPKKNIHLVFKTPLTTPVALFFKDKIRHSLLVLSSTSQVNTQAKHSDDYNQVTQGRTKELLK